jgi:hypothetical protein
MPVAAIAPIAGLGIMGNSAASAQSDAAKNAAAMQMQQAAQTQRVNDLNRTDQFPWLATGTNAVNTLSHLMGIAGGTSNAPWAPTYAGATPGAPNPFMVRSSNGAPGTIPTGNASSLNPNVPRGTSPQYDANFQKSLDASQANLNRINQNDPNAGFGQGGRFINDAAGSPVQNVAGTNDPVRSGFMLPNGSDGSQQQFMGPAQGQLDPSTSGGFTNMGTAGSAMAQGGAAGVPQGQQAPQADPNAGMSGDGSLAQSWTQAFNAPTNITEQNDPGYQARLKAMTDSLQNSAAARGNLLTGGTAMDIGNKSQDYASNEYGNVYNRALGQYQQNYNIFNNNQSNLFNRLSALSGGGQVTAANLGGGALQAAGQIGQSTQAAGNDLQNAAYQRASGYTNTGNAISSGLGNLGSLATALKTNNSNSNPNAGWGAI